LKKRHALKLALLIPALLFLFWWGWSGNFAFNSGSLFRLLDGETFYQVSLGNSRTGWARREIRTDPDTLRVTFFEETVLNLKLGPFSFPLITKSEAVFSQDGRLVSADFVIPVGGETAAARAMVVRDRLVCRVSLGETARQAEVPLPPSGPILVSGIGPWLSRQRDLPMGRPLGLELLDPVSMTFKPATLTIEDATVASDERDVYKLTLNFMGAENVDEINSDGRLLRHYNPLLEMSLEFLQDEPSVDVARREMAEAEARVSPLPGPLAAVITSFLSSKGMTMIQDVLKGGSLEGLAGPDSPWLKVEPPAPAGARTAPPAAGSDTGSDAGAGDNDAGGGDSDAGGTSPARDETSGNASSDAVSPDPAAGPGTAR
jgi:hypothetical protein